MRKYSAFKKSMKDLSSNVYNDCNFRNKLQKIIVTYAERQGPFTSRRLRNLN